MGVRVDKWLWSVRIFKSRTKATDACKAGQVFLGERKMKAADQVDLDQIVSVKKQGFIFSFRILKLIEKRVGAPIAVTCYEDVTPEEELNKYESWFAAAHARPEFRERGLGRPTKKDRRVLDDFKSLDDL